MGKFMLKQTDKGFSFNLLADNNQVVGTSEVYTTKEACKKGIESVQWNAPDAAIEDQTVEGFEAQSVPKFEIFKDKAGEFRFRLKAENSEIILVSEGYKAKPSCLKGIESVKSNSDWADIKEV